MVNNANILESTYDSLGTILRVEEVKDVNTGVTSTKLVKVYDNIKMALSKVDNQVMTSDGVGKLVFNHKVYTNPNITIKSGDTIEIDKHGKKMSFICSEPFVYDYSHQEILVSFKEYV